jgi:hypothetical protein
MTKLFSTPTPKIEDPAPLPDEDKLKKARQRMIAKETQTGGKSSTLLSTGGRETLGA